MKKTTWKLFVDGASRNNPGHSGAGIYIEKNAKPFLKVGYYLGLKTNNQAEYLALLLGLFVLSEYIEKEDTVIIISDSLLLVNQLSGLYKVKQPHLQPLYKVCKLYIQKFNASLGHVLRDSNSQADMMANYGVDNKILPPQRYVSMLHNHEIII